jgi:hypothetical protein
MNNEINLNKSVDFSEKSEQDNPFFNSSEFNPNLQGYVFTLWDLKRDIILRYGTYQRAGQPVNLSARRTKQILNGHFLPKSVHLIKQIAEGWNLDPVILTQLFERYRKEEK